MRGLSRPAPLVVALLAAAVVASCGFATSPSASVATPASAPTRSLSHTPEPPWPSSWLSANRDGVAFLTWTRSNDVLTGSLTWTRTNDALPPSSRTRVDGMPVEGTFDVTAAVSGTIDGRDVLLSLYPVLEPYDGRWLGTFNGERLRIPLFTARGWSLGVLDFVPGAVDDYNAALGAFRAALTRACSVRVPGRDTTIVVHGENARDECVRLVERLPLDPPDEWGDIRQPVEVSDLELDVVCTATIDSFEVEVQDITPSAIGSYVCRMILAPPP